MAFNEACRCAIHLDVIKEGKSRGLLRGSNRELYEIQDSGVPVRLRPIVVDGSLYWGYCAPPARVPAAPWHLLVPEISRYSPYRGLSQKSLGLRRRQRLVSRPPALNNDNPLGTTPIRKPQAVIQPRDLNNRGLQQLDERLERPPNVGGNRMELSPDLNQHPANDLAEFPIYTGLIDSQPESGKGQTNIGAAYKTPGGITQYRPQASNNSSSTEMQSPDAIFENVVSVDRNITQFPSVNTEQPQEITGDVVDAEQIIDAIDWSQDNIDALGLNDQGLMAWMADIMGDREGSKPPTAIPEKNAEIENNDTNELNDNISTIC